MIIGEDIFEHGDRHTVMLCRECGDEYSADPGDYFWLAPDDAISCMSCGSYDDMVLAQKYTTVIVIADRSVAE